MSSEALVSELGRELGEEELERSLRPRRLGEFVGQERLKEQLGIALAAASARGEALDRLRSRMSPSARDERGES